MPSLKLTNLLSYKNYFADIATKHKQIDDYKWGDKDVLRNDNRSDMLSKTLWAIPYESSRYGDSLSDNIVKTKQARIAYMIIPNSELFADEDVAYQYCESVIDDIVTKILLDKKGSGQLDGSWLMLVSTVSSFHGSPVEMKIGSTNYLGWELTFDFQDNANMTYDASKWD